MRTLLLLTLLFISSPCFAMDTIGPVFPSTPEFRPEYSGQMNERVYVSKAARESRYADEAKKPIIIQVHTDKAKDPVKVTYNMEYDNR